MSSGQKEYADEQDALREREHAAAIRAALADLSAMRDYDLCCRSAELTSLFERLAAGGTYTIGAAWAFNRLRALTIIEGRAGK